jgi:hypothetical protein
MSKIIAVALAAPGCVLAAATAVGLVMAAVDQPPMWPYQPVNLAEAAGVRGESEVVRLIEDGVDPDAKYPIRAGLIFAYPMSLTPLEAVVANDDPVMVKQLVAKGAALDASLWTHLRCIADGDRVPPVLDELRPPGAAETCEGVVRPWKAG